VQGAPPARIASGPWPGKHGMLGWRAALVRRYLEPIVAVTTSISRGSARPLAPPVQGGFIGGVATIVEVVISDGLLYSQQASTPLFHATLDHHALSARRGAGRADRRGEISFTPSEQVRHGALENSRIQGLEIAFDDGFLEEACEQPRGLSWQAVFNGRETKALTLALSLAEVCRAGEDRLTGDTLFLALARRLGRVYGGADRRLDDGWLHPKALRRVLDRLRAEPHQTSLGALAQDAGLSVSAFVRGFRGSVGKTPMAFALDVRLDQAAQALRASEMTIEQIARQTGFASASHLVYAFRGRHGLTPGLWRQRHTGS